MNLLSVVWNVSPIIFSLGSLEIRWYGVLYALAFIISYWLLKKLFTKEAVDVSYLDKLALYVFFAVIIGARLGHCLFYEPKYYLNHIVEMILPIKHTVEGWKFSGYQGLASHGGAIGILIAIILYSRNTKIPYMWVIERLIVAICFAGVCIRTGNLMNSEIYGEATSLPWGFIFIQDHNPIPSHPTQLYEALSYLIIGLILYYIITKKEKRHQGLVFGIFLTAVFGVRFLIEFLKNDQESWEADMFLNMGQILSLPFVIAGIVLIIMSIKRDIGKTLDKKLLTKQIK